MSDWVLNTPLTKVYIVDKKIFIDQWLGKYYCILGGIQSKQGIAEKLGFVPKLRNLRHHSPQIILHFLLSFKLFTLITRNCYININILVLHIGNLIINWIPLSHAHTVPERVSSQPNKIWQQGDFKNSDFPTLYWIGKNLEVQHRLILKNPNFLFLSWTGKNWVVRTA